MPPEQQPEQIQQPAIESQPVSNVQTPPAMLPQQPTPKKSKIVPILIGVIILLIILVISGWVYATKNKNNNNSSATKAPAVNTPATPSVNSNVNKSTVSKSADTVDTLCYSFALPTPHGDVGVDNRCTSSYMYGKDNVASVVVDIPVVPQVATLSELITNWKKHNTDSIVSETQTKLGTYDAQKIITKKTTVSSTTNNITLLVYTGNKYKIQNIAVSGFEIRGRYDDQYGSKVGIDSILASWQWK